MRSGAASGHTPESITAPAVVAALHIDSNTDTSVLNTRPPSTTTLGMPRLQTMPLIKGSTSPSATSSSSTLVISLHC